MNRKRKLACFSLFVLAAAFAVLATTDPGAAAAQGTTSCGTCRDPNNLRERSYCDPTTNQCVRQIEPCAPYFRDANGNENLCQPLQGEDPQTGECIYGNKFCAPTGCLTQQCNPSNGQCEAVPDDAGRCDPGGNDTCDNSSCSRNECFASTCSGFGQQDCSFPVFRDCNPVGSCRETTGCDPESGCVTTPVACAPPSNPCFELVRDPNAPGCCTYRPRDCAAEYGNDPNYTYSCDPNATSGLVCVATPKSTPTPTPATPTPTPPRVGPPTTKADCKNGGFQRYDFPRTFKNEGECIQFVNTGK